MSIPTVGTLTTVAQWDAMHAKSVQLSQEALMRTVMREFKSVLLGLERTDPEHIVQQEGNS